MISIAALLAPMAQPQLRASSVRLLKNFGVPADQWIAGGTYSTILTVVSYVFAGLTGVLSSALSAIFLPTATGTWLVALAYYVYGVTAQSATFGTGTATFSNTGGGVYNEEPGAVVIQAANGNRFTNTQVLALGPGTPLSPTVQTIDIQAQVQGSIGGAGAGQITQLVTSLTGVAVTNPTPIFGLDADSDATVRTKCIAAIAARSYKGPTGAYYAAIYGYGNVPGATNSVTGKPVNVNRIQVHTDPDTGDITVYLASPDGVADPNDVSGVQTAINTVARPQGITATAESCTVANFNAAITVWTTSAGVTAPQTIQQESLDAVDVAVAQYPIGGHVKTGTQGYLYASFITAAAASVDPTIFSVDLSSWSALPLNVGQVAAVTSAVTVRQVST